MTQVVPGGGFVRCVDARSCEDLELGSFYALVADPLAATKGFVRVVDGSGRARLYPPENFALELFAQVA